MQKGRAAWICSMDMQHENVAEREWEIEGKRSGKREVHKFIAVVTYLLVFLDSSKITFSIFVQLTRLVRLALFLVKKASLVLLKILTKILRKRVRPSTLV
jgi:hypothetical protein